MNRMAYICADPGVPIFGCKGASVHAQEVLRAMRRRGAGVELFTVRRDGAAAGDLRTLRAHWLPDPSRQPREEQEAAGWAANAGLAESLSAQSPSDSAGFALVYERYALWSFAGMEWARQRGIPSILEVNAPLIEEQAAHRGLVDRARAEEAVRRAMAAATVVACVSSAVADWARARVGLADRGKVHVVPNAVDPRRFDPDLAPRLAPEPGTFVVGFVGTLKPWHGLPVLAEAFARLTEQCPGARLLLVGDGPERRALEDMLAARGLRGRVHFTGAVDPDEVPGWLASMDVAVAPYPALEQFYFSPLKIFEYLAAGRPVVASRIGQVTELLRDGVTGLLVRPGDAGELAGALATLAADRGRAARLGAAGRAEVLRAHSWDATVHRLLRLARPTGSAEGAGVAGAVAEATGC